MKLRGLILLFLVIFCTKIVAGQEFTGRVTDQNGAVVVSAAVKVHNLLTGEEFTTKSNGDGVYTVPYLKAGEYSVTASATGFDQLVKNHITLEVGKTGVVNFALKVGAANITVTVEANVDLDAGKADRGEVVENTRVTELPLDGREPMMLAVLNAGVTWTGSLQYQRPFDSTQTNTSINGGGNANNVLNLDGVSNDSGSGNGVVGYVAPVDAVQEFKIVTNPYDAQFGRGQGGVEDVILKSGTNQLHGDVYEFAKRTWLDADTWSNDYYRSKGNSEQKGQHKLDQYGAELDGPLVIPHFYNGRDKTFFVLQYENWSELQPNTMTTSVPDPAWLTGDFSNLTYWTGSIQAPMTIYDPLTIQYNKSARDQYARTPFSNNQIPSGRINPVAKTLLSYYPAPNVKPPSNGNLFANNYFTPNPTADHYRNVLAKLDHNFGEKDRFSLRYGYWERWETRSDNGMPGLAVSGAEPFGQHGPTFATDWVHTFSPSLIFDLRGAVMVRYNGWHNGPQNFPLSSINWPAGAGTHMPLMKLSEFATLGNGGANIDIENSAALLPSLTWIKGNHTVHLGADLRDLQRAIKSTEDGSTFWIDRQWTQSDYIGSNWDSASGNSIASALLGTPSTDYNIFSGTTNISQAYWTRHYIAPFIQDDWKITRKLTLNLGVRYDINTPIYERHNRVDYAFDPTEVNPVDKLVNHALIPGGAPVTGAVTFAGVNGNPRTYYAQSWNNIQPRLGVAYALNGKTVLRGGFGEMFKNPIPGGNSLGWSSSTAFNATPDGGKTPGDTFSNPFPNGIVQPAGSATGALTDLGQGPWFINPNYKTPGIWQYSAGVQREFLKSDTIEVSYVGSRAFNQDSSDNINHWDPAYQATCDVEQGGNANTCNSAYDPNSATTTGYVPNPFVGISAFAGSNYFTAPTIQYGNLTRPNAAFGDVIEYQLNDGRTRYDSLQITAIHRGGKNLTLHGTWTWSKLLDTGGYADETYRIKAHSLDGNDITHRITLSGVYLLPVGRGRALLGHTNRIVDAAVGGWELGALYIYQTGTPWGMPGGLEYLKNPKVSTRIELGASNPQIRGVNGCISDPYHIDSSTGIVSNDWSIANSCTADNAVFKVRPQYAINQNVIYSGVRIPGDQQFDGNLSKNFALFRDLKAQFRLEAFNVLNHPLWQAGYDGNPQNATFGTIIKSSTGQSNLPRQVQIAVKLMW